MRRLLALVDHLNTMITFVVGLLLIVIAACILGQVIVRFVLTAFNFNISAPWTEELARYLLIWMVFLGAGVGCRKMQMISLEFLVRSLPSVPGQALRYGSTILCVGFFALLVNVGLPFVDLGASESSPVMVIPKSWVYMAMPVGCSLMILNSFAFMAEAAVERRDIRTLADAKSLD